PAVHGPLQRLLDAEFISSQLTQLPRGSELQPEQAAPNHARPDSFPFALQPRRPGPRSPASRANRNRSAFPKQTFVGHVRRSEGRPTVSVPPSRTPLHDVLSRDAQKDAGERQR